MAGKQLNTKILAVRIIPNADPMLLKNLDVRPGDKSLGIFTTDCDDVSYTAVDEATKKADVHVAYAKSMYAGSGNASTALAGEFIGILSGPDPEEVRSGLQAAFSLIENDAHFYEANETGMVVYFAHCISRTGSYLSSQAGVPEGTPMAYLIAPPLEASVGLDAALKAADVELSLYYGPPTETNFAGGLLTGTQASCQAACDAFADAVCRIAEDPLAY
ncbi:microcompartment protein EutL [Clostridium sp. OF03-18AA]|nr:ethanolamine utilization microcompartment protein EutL [Clostridium sp. OF03-18AA]RHP71657.1 microcompartment protein EutL [Clostridium sp. OF03-18AA]